MRLPCGAGSRLELRAGGGFDLAHDHHWTAIDRAADHEIQLVSRVVLCPGPREAFAGSPAFC
jgi:hypothetical protein